jgi:AraC-like DNA-binding protein
MSLDLTAQEVDEIWLEAEQQCPPVTSIDRLETLHSIPSILGSGYYREIDLYPGLDLCIHCEIYHHDMIGQALENQHLVQFQVLLSGVLDGGDLVRIDTEQSYVGGSGIQRSFQCFSPQAQPLIGVDIHMQPHLLSQFFAAPTGELPTELQPLVRGDDWQRIFSPKTTGAMRSVVQQIIDCPFWGATKRLYLQAKVFELMALQLHSIVPAPAADSSLKPSTIARIHQAADLLRSHLEHPPSQTELARQVGVSDRTLRRGFRELFDATVFGYLTVQRMVMAERLLRQGTTTIEAVAGRVGYANPSHFAAAFKRQFGISPSECAMGVMHQR